MELFVQNGIIGLYIYLLSLELTDKCFVLEFLHDIILYGEKNKRKQVNSLVVDFVER